MKRPCIVSRRRVLLAGAVALLLGPSPVGAATADSLAFVSLSNQARPDSRIRVYPTITPGDPLMLRGYNSSFSGPRKDYWEVDRLQVSELEDRVRIASLGAMTCHDESFLHS